MHYGDHKRSNQDDIFAKWQNSGKSIDEIASLTGHDRYDVVEYFRSLGLGTRRNEGFIRHLKNNGAHKSIIREVKLALTSIDVGFKDKTSSDLFEVDVNLNELPSQNERRNKGKIEQRLIERHAMLAIQEAQPHEKTTPTAKSDSQDDLISKILEGESSEFKAELTPDDASLLLELNDKNRMARPRISQTYADDMINGRWIYAGDPIRFDTAGTLIDGQHRLSALASLKDSHSDISFTFMIITGLDPKSQSVMDQGTKRTTADNLGIQGIRFPKDVASAARSFIQWTSGTLFTTKMNIGNVEVQEWVEANPEFIETTCRAIKYRKDIDLPASLYIGLYAAFYEIDQHDADKFLEMWATGINLYAGHPVLALRDKLARNRRERLSVTPRENLAMRYSLERIPKKNLTRFSRPKAGFWTKEDFPTPE
jgi:hypothetical protein